jgi:predicted molibdopterin-dependent oxidoreductase YjgC
MSITLTINNQAVTVAQGASVLDAVNAAGTYVSQLCKDPDMRPIGACRTCLVQIEGTRGFPASCSVPARDGMKVFTDTPEVRRIRAGVLELTLGMVSKSPLTPLYERGEPSPPPLQRGKEGDFHQLTIAARHHGIAATRWSPRAREATDTSNTVFDIAMDSCILCARCVNACQSGHQFIGAIDFLGAGRSSRIGTFMDQPLAQSICTTCGQCLSVCPTGAIAVKEPPGEIPPTPLYKGGQDVSPLSQRGARGYLTQAARTVTTTCPYCGVGCGLKLQVNERDEIIAAQDDPDNRSSIGMLCVKGRFGHSFVHHPDRLTTPLIKEGGEFRPASWEEALDLVADRLLQYRGRAFATLCSAKATNEDGYVQQKWARLIMQTNNIDHCTRLCHSPSVEAMLTSLGSGATSNSYTDYETAGCLVVTGCDPTSNHPVAASRMRRAVVERGAKLIVINPRRIDMCDYADLWLRPYPGTDVALLNGLANVILTEGLLDREFVARRTEGFDQWASLVARYTPDYVEQITGVPAEDLRQAARMYAKPPLPGKSPLTPLYERGEPSRPPLQRGKEGDFGGSCLIWGMGITQHTNGTANAHGLLNLALVAGQLGKPGSGISPLRGQNNVQGCGDAGCLPNSLPGYQSLTPATIAKFQAAWGGYPLPETPGLVVTEMVESMARPEGVKAMFITGENPLTSEPDLHHAEAMFRNLEFLVVQDLFLHETAQMAHVVLPAASFAEKEGTFTNSERRVQRVRQAIPPVGQSRPDWDIISDLARRMARMGAATPPNPPLPRGGRRSLPLDKGEIQRGSSLEAQFRYQHPSEIWDEMARLTPIVAGISYPRLDREGGIQWPCPTADHPGTPYLYADSFPRGPRAKFVAFEQGPSAAEMPNRRFPLILNTGRVLYHWHSGTLTRRVAGLLARAPDLQVAISPEDADRYGISDGQEVRVTSRRGELTGKALVTDRQRAGEIFIPFVKLQESAANFLTNAAYDPTSKIPEYKVCAVRVEGVEGDDR